MNSATAPAEDLLMQRLAPYVRPDRPLSLVERLPAFAFATDTRGLRANAHYFGHERWVKSWFEGVHRSPELRDRWHAAAGTWDDKVVVDVGCGPGNLFATLGGSPRELIGVDVAPASLRWAQKIGYLPVLADAHAMPLRSEIADVVALNGTIHHCDDMAAVLAESARLVRPGGLLVADHDPQLSAYDLKFLGRLMWELRMPIYRLLRRGGHSPDEDEQAWSVATEIHHRPGDGVSAALLRSVLEPLGFEVRLYPHNHNVGAGVLRGECGRAPLKMRLVQRLSGIAPDSDAGALSLLCVARKRADGY
jgi:SAM-dependent methyltransferase